MTDQGARSYETELMLSTGTVVRVREAPAEVVHRIGVARKGPGEGLVDLTRDAGSVITVVAQYVVFIEPRRDAE